MYPPSTNINLDLEALSGISGSISIACWVVVFSPQIIVSRLKHCHSHAKYYQENFRRGSAEGLSIVFIVVWLLGDIFNIIGAVLQGVLPTMIILAVYYTLADIVLLIQLFYYRGLTLSDEVKKSADTESSNGETRPLLSSPSPRFEHHQRNSFSEEFRRHGQHLSPATPLLNDAAKDPPAIRNQKPTSTFQTVLLNSGAVLLVCAAGILGWYISMRQGSKHHRHKHYDKHDTEPSEPLDFDTWGQFFGYLCAVFYLGSRVPQLLLNYRRKSTEGVSLLFFLFACIGNLTYDLSIFAYNPRHSCELGSKHCRPGEASEIYARYIAVNASWIAGSLGTLFLDGAIFVQFFLYKKDDEEDNIRNNGHVTGPEHAVSD